MLSSIRYTVTVPYANNRGESLRHVHNVVRNALHQITTGWTEHTATGEWAGEDGLDIREDVIVFAVDTDHDEDSRIRDIAQYVKDIGEQESVYVTKQPIWREFV